MRSAIQDAVSFASINPSAACRACSPHQASSNYKVESDCGDGYS